MAKPSKNKSNTQGAAQQVQETPSVTNAGTTSGNSATVPGVDGLAEKLKGKETWVVLGALMLTCLIVFRDFIFLDKVYLYTDIGSDSINIYFPWLVHMTEYMKHTGVPTWTFSQGLGQNLFPFWLGDFFSNFMMLFDKSRLPYMIGYMEVLKVILGGFVFYKYLCEMNISKYVAGIGGYLFAFSGYIVLGSCWTVFSAEAVYVSLILLGFERWMNRGRFLWFGVGLTAISMLQPFLLFPYTLLLAFYVPVRFYDKFGAEWGKFAVFALKTVGIAVVAVAIGGYQLFPDLLQYIESPRVGGEATLSKMLKSNPMFGTAIPALKSTTSLRAFGADLLGTGLDFKGWNNYLEAPLFYCGVISLVAFPQVFVNVDKGKRIALGILMGVFCIPILFPYFRYAFWAFTGDYFRTFSFVIVLLMLFFTTRAIDGIMKEGGKLNLIVLGGTVLFLLFLLYGHPEEIEQGINSSARSVATVLVLVYAGLLYGLSTKTSMRKMAITGLAVLVGIEAIMNSSTTVNDRGIVTAEQVTAKVGYNDYSQDAVDFVKKNEKGFYRVNKDYGSGLAVHGSINDGKVQGFFGTQSYFSFNQKNYIRFLGDLNIIDPTNENATRWARGVGGRPLLMCLTSNKYWIAKKNSDFLLHYGYDLVQKFNDITLYKNKYSLPLGITFDKVMDTGLFKKISMMRKDQILMQAAVVENKELMDGFQMVDSNIASDNFNYDSVCIAAINAHHDSLKITSFKENHIQGEIDVPKPQILFFSFPYDEGWSVTVNGTKTPLYKVDCGLTGLKIPAGKNNIDLVFEPRYKKEGGMASLGGLVIFIGLLVAGRFMQKKESVA